MKNPLGPFEQIATHLKTEPIEPFRRDTVLARKYLRIVQTQDLKPIFIGWMCKRDSFFAYMFKRMKKEARDSKTTKLAAGISRAGFQNMLPEINKWILSSIQPVLIIPAPSRHGVSEKFASELYKMLDNDSKKISKLKEIFSRTDNTTEIKKINGWDNRNNAAENLFMLDEQIGLDQYAVLLVDDIITSGASLKRLTALLKSRGAKKIAAVSLATNLFDSY